MFHADNLAFNMTAPVRDTRTISLQDQEATVRGWVQETRNLGGISFIVIRDRFGTLQITAPKKKIESELFRRLTGLPRESVVEVSGEVKKSDQTALGLELIPKGLMVYTEALSPLPLGVVDKVHVEADTRINNRFMDMRRPEVRAVFELKSLLMQLIGEAMRNLGFTQVNTPKLVSSGAEGGSTLFQVDYFGRPAFLAQSPQLYKQMLMSTGMDRVFEMGPAFRAEHSNTVRHVSEFISFDGEMSWIDSQKDVMETIESVLSYVFPALAEQGAEHLSILGKKVVAPRTPYPVLGYRDCLDMLAEAGMTLEDGDDLGTEGEKLIGEMMAQDGYDMYWIVEYPEREKPFYIMEKDGTPYSYSFDLDYKGQEISSGGQREHRYDRLVQRMEAKGLDIDSFHSYLDAFRYGMPPHGGWGIGLERLLVKMLDLPNIREAILFPRDVNRLTP